MNAFVFALLGFEHSVANTVLTSCYYAYANDDKQSERMSRPNTKSGATMWAHRNP